MNINFSVKYIDQASSILITKHSVSTGFMKLESTLNLQKTLTVIFDRYSTDEPGYDGVHFTFMLICLQENSLSFVDYSALED